MAAPIVFACPDWAERLRSGQAPYDLGALRKVWNKDRVAAARRQFGSLILPDQPGTVRLGDAAGPWFLDLVDALAGALLPGKGGVIGQQLVQTALLSVGKKNGKTTLSAGLALTLFLLNPRPRATFLFLAPTIPVAQLAFEQVVGMIYSDPGLRALLEVREYAREVRHRQSGATLAVRAFEQRVAVGARPSFILIDEVHELTRPDAARVLTQLRGAGGAIPESQMLAISTMADGPSRGIWANLLGTARRVRDGQEALPGFLPALYEPPADLARDLEAMCEPSSWAYANPNLGRSQSMTWLEASFAEARETGPQAMLSWLSQFGNLEISEFGAALDGWGGAEIWARRAAPEALTFDELLDTCTSVVFGFDGGGGDDLLALAALFDMPDGTRRAWTHAWAWPVLRQRRKSVATLLDQFEAQGDLTTCAAGDDLRRAAAYLVRAADAEKLAGCGVDPAGVASLFGDVCEALGLDRQRDLCEIPQGFRLAPAWHALDRWLQEDTLRHNGQPLLDWAVSNCRMAPSGLITKAASGIAKIDPAVACASAAMLLLSGRAPVDVDAMVTFAGG